MGWIEMIRRVAAIATALLLLGMSLPIPALANAPENLESPTVYDSPTEDKSPSEHEGPIEREGPTEYDHPTELAGPMENEDPTEYESPTEHISPDFESPEDVISSIPSVDRIGDTVYTWAGFTDWLAEHDQSGGTVTLGANIAYYGSVYETLELTANAPVSILTEMYGLVVHASLKISAYFTIVGEGVDQPVLTLTGSYPSLFISCPKGYGHDTLHITATGRDGVGGCAIRIEVAEEYKRYSEIRPYFPGHGWLDVRASGTDAIAVHSTQYLEMQNVLATAIGDGSTALRAKHEANLTFCKLEADGKDIDAKGVIRLYNCIVSQETEEAAEETYTFRVSRPYNPKDEMYARFGLGDTVPGDFFMQPEICMILLSTEDDEHMNIPMYVRFTDPGVRTEKTFFYGAPGTFLPSNYDLFDIVPESFAMEKTIVVADARIPYIRGVAIIRGNPRYPPCITIYTDFGMGGPTSWKGVSLWRRDGTEGDFYDISDQVEMGEANIYYDTYDVECPMQFQLRVEGVGESDVITVVDGGKNGARIGDRDGGDRVTVRPDPPGENGGNENGGDEQDGGYEPPVVGPGTQEPQPGESEPGNEMETRRLTAMNRSGGEQIPAASKSHTGGIPAVQGALEPDAAPVMVTKNVADGEERKAEPHAAEEKPSPVADAGTAQPTDTGYEAPKPTSLREYEDETTIALSGKRIAALLLANPQSVPFSRQDMQLWIPAGILEALELQDDEILTVQLLPLAGGTFSIVLSRNGVALTGEFDEALLVGMPWPESGEVRCTLQGGGEADTWYDVESGLLMISLYSAGTYSVERVQHSAAAVQTIGEPAVPIVKKGGGWVLPMLSAGGVGISGVAVVTGLRLRRPFKRGR